MLLMPIKYKNYASSSAAKDSWKAVPFTLDIDSQR